MQIGYNTASLTLFNFAMLILFKQQFLSNNSRMPTSMMSNRMTNHLIMLS